MTKRLLKKLDSFKGKNGINYKLLTPLEHLETIKWCIENFKPGMYIDDEWHPVIVNKLTAMQKNFDYFKNLSEQC